MRQSLEAMTYHANKQKLTHISMPKAVCGPDRFKLNKVECLILEIGAQSNKTITVCDQNKTEKSQMRNETPKRFALGQAQRQDEVLFKLIQ